MSGKALFPAGAAEGASRRAAGQLAIGEFQLTIHEDVFYSFGQLCRLCIGRLVLNRDWIKYGDIREVAFPEESAIGQALALCGKGSHFPDGLLERKQMLVAHIVAEKAWHGAKGAWVRVRFVERPIQRQLACIEAETRPWLLQAVCPIVFLGH